MPKLPDYAVSHKVKHVLVICKSHLDIGFTNRSAAVRQTYLEEFIPKAIALARRFERPELPVNFVWNTGSWLIHEYSRFVRGRAKAEFEAAVRDGLIAWHALPFTTHTELADPSLYEAGLKMARELDARFGKTTIAAKMTDVPGHTGGLVPLLARNGVKFLHLGVNPASPAPAVPPVCRWRRDGREVLLMYAAGDYGDNVLFEPYGAAVVFAHGGDNSAPMSEGALLHLYRTLMLQYPAASIRFGTLDDLANLLLPHAADFPVFTGEIGDSWIHGLGTDPGKVAAFRELSRFRREILLGDKKLKPEVLGEFERNLLLLAEHTWGLDIKSFLADDHTWLRPDFDAAYRVRPNFHAVAKSWCEQRMYLKSALAALPEPLRHEGHKRLASLKAKPFVFPAVRTAPPKFSTRHFKVAFNAHGELATIAAADGSVSWSKAGKPFFSLAYLRYNDRDVERFLGEYCRWQDANRAAWARWDMGKPGLPEGLPSDRSRGEDAEFAVFRRAGADIVRARFGVKVDCVRNAGAPARFEVEYRFPDAEALVEITVQWFGKPPNRMPESIQAAFAPAFGRDAVWRMNKLGSTVDPLEVVSRGSRSLHAVGDCDSLVIRRSKHSLAVDSIDAPLLLLGRETLWRFSDRLPDLDAGFSFCLHNNQWGTNFPMWYGDDGRFRFRVRLG